MIGVFFDVANLGTIFRKHGTHEKRQCYKIPQMKASLIFFESYVDSFFVQPTTRASEPKNKRRSENLCAHGLL